MGLRNDSIIVKKLSLEYHEFSRTKKNPWGAIKGFKALDRISFDIKEGETIALLGRNGAGKSTLLKALGGLLRPSEGKIITYGRVILLAGVDPGFIPDLSGRQNILELSKAYGIKDDEIEIFSKSIEDFAGLGEAFDRRFGGYSTGMRGKLGFGFITALDPAILLIDETLGVGDIEFRKKAQTRLKEFIRNSGTVIISTHSLGLAKELCDRGLLLDKGILIADGEINNVIGQYSSMVN